MRLFITGATGFVGAHLAQLAAAQGAQLRLLTRTSSNTSNLPRGAEVVVGDLREPARFASALQGCDAVIHVAADYRLWVPDPAEMYKANVEGTRELLRLARETGVRRVVYTSSVATMGFDRAGTVVDEETPVGEADMIGHYKRSKWMAEQEALAAARAGQEVMVLNPTTPIGSMDTKPTPTGRIVLDFLNKNFPAYVETGLNLVDVDEVARMHLVAIERGVPGGALYSRRRESDAEADPGPAGHDDAAALADDEGAACGGDGVCVLRRDDHWQAAREGAASYCRGCSHGAQDDVCEFGEGGAGVGAAGDERRWGASCGGGVVRGAWVCAGVEGVGATARSRSFGCAPG